MSNTVSRKSGSTALAIGSVRTPVALYKIIGDPSKARKWDLANDAGEPFEPPARGGDRPPPPAAAGAPLGEAPPAAEEVESEESTTTEVPDAAFDAGDVVWLDDGSEHVVISTSRAAASPDADAHWQYALTRDADPASSNPGYEENPVPEWALYSRSPIPRKGIRKADGTFVDLTDQIEEIAERVLMDEMRIVSFIDVRHVPRERIISSYYLAGDAFEGNGVPPHRLLAVLMRAMRAGKRVAVVRFSKRVGQTLGVLTPRRDGSLVLLELAYSAQERDPNPTCLASTAIEPREGEVEAAMHLIEAMAGKRDSLDGIGDPRLAAEEELIARAEAGELDEYELTADEDDEVGQLGDLLAAAAVA